MSDHFYTGIIMRVKEDDENVMLVVYDEDDDTLNFFPVPMFDPKKRYKDKLKFNQASVVIVEFADGYDNVSLSYALDNMDDIFFVIQDLSILINNQIEYMYDHALNDENLRDCFDVVDEVVKIEEVKEEIEDFKNNSFTKTRGGYERVEVGEDPSTFFFLANKKERTFKRHTKK